MESFKHYLAFKSSTQLSSAQLSRAAIPLSLAMGQAASKNHWKVRSGFCLKKEMYVSQHLVSFTFVKIYLYIR